MLKIIFLFGPMDKGPNSIEKCPLEKWNVKWFLKWNFFLLN